MEIKSKKSKKNKTSDFDFQQVATDIASDTKTCAVDDPQKEKDQRKKKKSKSGGGFHIDALSTLETVSANLSEENKSNRKNKKKDHHGEIVIKHIDDGTIEKDSLEVDGEVQREKERKKKRKSNNNFEENVTEMGDGEELAENKKAARREKDGKGRKSKGDKKIVGGVVGEAVVCSERENVEKVEKKKRKREKQKENDNLGDGETDSQLTLSKIIGGEDEVGSKSKKKTKKTNAVENGSEDPQPKRKSKNVSFSSDGDEYTEIKKTSKKEKDGKGRKSKEERKTEDEGVEESMVCSEGGTTVDKVEKKKKKKRKREKQKENDNLRDGETDGQSSLITTIGGENKVGSKGKKKKKTSVGENGSEDPKPKRKSKKVSFSSEVEVFPSTVRGKRFTKEEDEIVKKSVLNYIEAHGLGDEGINMVMHCKDYPGIKNCWKEISAALPHRPYLAVYNRAHNLFERDETSKWTEEDLEFVRKAQKEHGNDWKAIAKELGKHRVHVKDTWRRIKLQGQKKGPWSQEEYQNLYDLVNLDLQMKLDAEKLSKYGMLRDNIPWTAISDKLTTRSDAICCMKWYGQLTSSMVAEGLWADADDYRLIGALYDMDASCEGDVDWDNLLEHRSGDLCRKRWNQMVLHIGYHGCKPFADQVEALAQRYCPNLAETREAWDSKPFTQ